ncbi:MAG: DNA-binding protein [Gemmataceae bacterium]|nr:DNA-binding protein [Gemmataceae bacterium]
MTTISIPLSDDGARRLHEMAREASVSPEELVRASVEQWLSHPKEDFVSAANYVLRKNAELYRRLA